MKKQLDLSYDVEIPVLIVLIAVLFLVYGSWCFARAGLFGTMIAIAINLLFLLFYLIIINIQGGIKQ